MIVEYRKRFLKELAKLPSEIRQKIEKFVFEDLPEANSIYEVGVIEQMSYLKDSSRHFTGKSEFGKMSIVGSPIPPERQRSTS